MALDQDTISINIAQGVNNKIDDKLAGPNQSSVLTDARFTKEGRLVKRNGITAKSQSFTPDPGFLNPVVINSVSHKAAVFTHQGQLCEVTNGNFLSQYDAQDKWIFKGTYVPMEVNLNRLDANVIFSDTVTVNGITLSCGSQSIYVTEESTGNIVSKTTLASTEFALRAIGFQSNAYILTNSTASAVLNARPVSLSTGVVGSQITVASDYLGYYQNPINLSVTSSASAIGEAAFITYATPASVFKVVPFLSSGTVSGLGALTLGSVAFVINAITIQPSVNPNKFYVSGAAKTGNVTTQAWTFSASTYTNVYSVGYLPVGNAGQGAVVSTNSYHAITQVVSPVNNSDLFVYVDSYQTVNSTFNPLGATTYSDDRILDMIRIGSGGAVISNYVYSRGLSLAGQAFRDNVRKTIYVPCVYVSPLQTTVLLLDTLEGQNGFNYLMAKTLYGEASSFTPVADSSAPNVFPLSQVYPTSSGGDVFRLVNNGYFVDFDLTPQNSLQNQFFANTTHLTGGFLWAYDGQSLAEHNFLISPERMSLSVGTGALGIGIITQGDGSHAERWSLSVSQALAFKTSSPQNQYFQFDTTTGSSYGWFTVDSVGTDPAVPGRTGILIALNGTDTGEDVAVKITKAINASGVAATAASTGQSPSVTVTNTSNGAVADPTVQGNGRSGGLSPGSYQYTFIYNYRDKNGNIYRSAPAVPTTVAAVGSAAGSMTLWAPPITNKLISQVEVDIFRTLADGTTFFKLDSSLTMSSASVRIGYFDTYSDDNIETNEILYTNGGVLENYNIAAVKTVSFFKERIVVGGVDDGQSVYYSKANVINEPVNFSAELFFNVDADEGNVTAVAPMDDKLVTFKNKFIYVTSGDGANDLGQGSTLSPPMLVASDVGTTIPNSVILYPNGLMFKSDKGIYNLDRALGVDYIGAPVEDYNSFTVSGAVLMKNQTEIRFTMNDTSTAVVYNYFFGRWDFFSNYQSDAATVWNGKMSLVRNTGKVFTENTGYYDVDVSSSSYSMSLETVWLKLKGLQDFQRIYTLSFLGQYLSPHTVNVNVSYDYDTVVANSFDYTFNSAEIIGNPNSYPGASVYQFQVNLVRQKCEAIKVKFTEIPGDGFQQSLYLNNLSANVGLKKGLDKLPNEKNV